MPNTQQSQRSQTSQQQAAALRHCSAAEQQATDMVAFGPPSSHQPIMSCGICGAGTMGGGIAMSFDYAVLASNTSALDTTQHRGWVRLGGLGSMSEAGFDEL